MFTDEQDIDRELKAALNVEPSSGFETRVLRRVGEDQPERRRGLPAWLAAAAAVIVLAGVWFAMKRETPRESGRPDVVASRPVPAAPVPATPQAATPQAETPQAETPRVDAVAAPATPRATVRAERQEPQVIVPPGQLALIQRLLREANAGRVDLPEDAAGAPAAPAELIIPAMTIEPIALSGAEPGGGPSRGPRGLQ